MKVSEGQCITLTVFYGQSVWHKLLSSFIVPFTKNALHNKVIETFYVFLGTDRGEHIRLCFKSLNNNDGELLNQLLSDINRYLRENESFTKVPKYPLSGFFMDYPNNSLLLNKKGAHVCDNLSRGYVGVIRESISSAIIKALIIDEIEMEGIYTFFIYLQLGIIKAAWPDGNDAYINTINLADCNVWENLDDDMDFGVFINQQNESFKGLFEQNKSLLIEILDEIWNGPYGEEMLWLKEWETSCTLLLGTLGTLDFPTKFILTSELILDHLGFASKKALLRPSVQLITSALKAFNEI